MTEELIRELITEKQGLFVDSDLIARIVESLIPKIIKEEIERHIGAKHYEHAPAREGRRNGTKPRTLKTRIGELHFDVPQVRGNYFRTGVFERYQRSEKALVSAMQEMVIQGVSTRDVKKVMEEMGGFEISASTVPGR